MFKPGKGVRFIVDRDILQWLEDTMAQVNEAYDEPNPTLFLAEWSEWVYFEPDQYGDKVVKSIDLENGNELRVSVISNHKGLGVDIREWYVADES